MSLRPGRRLGSYEIVSSLGAGGMGEVYRARDSRLDRVVAIKVLPEHLAGQPEALRRFEREAKAVAALSHPNILAIHELDTEEGVRFAVMELLEGENLRSRLRGSPLPWGKAAEIGAAVCEGVAAAHARGIIHRDLKPENIFVTSDGRIKILDFGLARQALSGADDSEAPTLSRHTDPGTVLGTAGYMSPEQVRGETADHRSDIFSLGVVLYELLTGRRPFGGATSAETMAAILRDDPAPLADSQLPIPPALERIVSHCLEKNPDARLQSARDLAHSLRDVSAQATLPPAVPARGRAVAARRLWKVAAVLPLLAVAILYVRARHGGPIDSLAILPFASADPATEYLSDGITETLINSFSRLAQLHVMPRTTVFRFKGKDVDPLAVGQQLKVRAVVAGRVTQRGQTLNVQAELLDVAEGSQIWGEQFSRDLSGMLTLQDEISKEILGSLRLRLSPADESRLAKRPTESTEAHQLYLKGRYFWNKRGLENRLKAVELYQQALEKDPAFALAHTGIADAYAGLGVPELAIWAPAEAFGRTKIAAKKALEADENLSEAHVSQATAEFYYDWDWSGAERDLKRAMELQPTYAHAYHAYSHYAMAMGRAGESLAASRRALELDPANLVLNAHLVWHYCYARQPDQAIEQARKSLELDPNVNVHLFLGWAYEQKGLYAEAIGEFQKAASGGGLVGGSVSLAALGHAYAVAGRAPEARKVLEDLKARSKEAYVSSYEIALLHAGLGEKDEAFARLDKALEERASGLVLLRVEPRLESLRSDPRFGTLLRRVGLD